MAAPELRVGDFDAVGGEAQIEIERRQAVQRDRQPVPGTRVGGHDPNAGYVRREVERVRSQRALHGLVAVGREREHAFGAVAVELDVDVGQRHCVRVHVALGAQCETAEAAERHLVLAGPLQRLAQRR